MHASSELPDAGLGPQPVNVDQFRAYTPEKFELLEGYLFNGAEAPEERLRLLRLLLVNVGLVEAVKLAPEATWPQALRQAYGA